MSAVVCDGIWAKGCPHKSRLEVDENSIRLARESAHAVGWSSQWVAKSGQKRLIQFCPQCRKDALLNYTTDVTEEFR